MKINKNKYKYLTVNLYDGTSEWTNKKDFDSNIFGDGSGDYNWKQDWETKKVPTHTLYRSEEQICIDFKINLS